MPPMIRRFKMRPASLISLRHSGKSLKNARARWRNPLMPGFPCCASFASDWASACIFGRSTGGTSRPGARQSPKSIRPCGAAAANEDRTSDQHDAYSIAAWLARRPRRQPRRVPQPRPFAAGVHASAGGGLDIGSSRLDPRAGSESRRDSELCATLKCARSWMSLHAAGRR